MIEIIFSIAQLIIATLLIASILLQARGSGLGSAFGGEGNVYRTKRGIEKRLFQTTIILTILFFGVSLASLLFISST
ncbi:preprotein translocase subunit SecG [Candidatus Uhrbacteria bacterium CG_4_9_14_3_um_filter_36_7]|uniref:Protein-export membrane protein SecG n=1 Tax=Candidatus Uhrbacteria bacterium CG_4_9_14_3_um_filter_36_7 TaxID=1975033 RepID=A0A2M7XFW0_9BACT|nr:MAG: preprotein translocase subunit SecG [Candidatus Uhrbacteria bacterium CG_4_9_14_3_um_filter_36_7]